MKVEHMIISLKDFYSCFKCLVFCSKWANSRGYVFYYISSPGLQIVDILEAVDMKLLTKGRMFLPRVPVKKIENTSPLKKSITTLFFPQVVVRE